MRKILLFVFLFLLGVSTAHAEDGDVVDIYSNPDEMIKVESAPKAFMYKEPYFGYLDDGGFVVSSTEGANLNFAHDNDKTTYAHLRRQNKLVYVLNEEVDIKNFYIYALSDGVIFNIAFYDKSGNRVKIISTDKLRYKGELIQTVDALNVKKIEMWTGTAIGDTQIYEFDFEIAEIYLPVFNLSSTTTDKSIKINWDLPDHKKLTAVKVNGKSIGKVREYTQNKLESNKEYEYNIAAVYEDGTEINTVYKARTLIDQTPPEAIKNLKIKQIGQDVELSYDLPKDDDFHYVVIQRNNQIITFDEYKEATFRDKNLKYNVEYTYKIFAYDTSGNRSTEMSGKITLITQEVTNLKANAKYDQVELTWNLPNASGLKNVVIYRKNNDVGMFARMFKSTETPLFETNGTQFKDLTVEADTSYTYRVASVYEEETQGATVSVKTPKVIVNGGGSEKDENGDYVITWTSPTTGKIKVLVGGKQYAIVPASDKKIVIPKDKMVFDLIGNPDVQLIPIDDNGNEGIPSKPGGGNSGGGGGIGDIVGGGDLAEVLNPENTVKAGMQLLALVGLFLLLGLAFRIVPKLINMIRNAFLNKKNENIYGGRRRVEE